MKRLIQKITSAVLTVAMLIPITAVMPITASAYTASNVPSYLFDAEYYANKYSDLKAAFGTNKTKLYNHWINNGMKEGRSPSPIYDPSWYLSHNADVKKVYGNDYEAVYKHFMSSGVNEFRSSSAIYDGNYYKTHYSDLQKAFGINSVKYMEHFMNNGMAEHRQGSSSFNAVDYKNRYSDLKNAFGNNWKQYYYHYLCNGISEGRNGSSTGKNSPADVGDSTGGYRIGWVKTSGASLNMRITASTSSSIVVKIPNGAALTLLNTTATNGFYYASYNGYNGYVSSAYISLSEPDTSKSTLSVESETSSSTGIVSPVPTGCYFNKKTKDCGGSNWYGYHDININVSTSTPVYAIADGTVTYRQTYYTNGGKKYLISYGNNIKFTSADGVYTATYAHLDRFNGVNLTIPSSQTEVLSASSSKVKNNGGSKTLTLSSNKRVSKGDIIGYIGTTGNSTGIHLHFELYQNGNRIDPTSVIAGLTK